MRRAREARLETEIVYAQIYTFSPAGKITRVMEYATREEAVKALRA